ncbi:MULTISPECIES: DUF445 domain-containing protein [unclassified Romboutsia]|uniref:DUF445 domain-containing protein n=1 Tax=unclassified Romboutsia TaxID=2626894 RepID=UPI0008231EA0|nr:MULTISPECIES: DUF445 family protein [unclassified Romboutsia]SCH99309.1 Predicted membrane protein [uncultured Clostridium sp.]
MSNILKVMLLASIGGVIGYITNVLAIKLIFRPIQPIKIPILNFEIIGLIPKRRNEISKNIGEIIQDEFLSMDEILESIMTENDKEKIIEYIKEKINNIAQEKMSFVPFPIRGMIEGYIMDAVDSEVRVAINELSEEMINKAKERINIQEMVETKINELDLYELEDLIIRVAKKELKHIEVLGLILGFLIGIIQGIIVIFI